MIKRYNPSEIEPKWQAKWAKDKIYKAVDFDTKPKFTMLTEFPYPSGDGLHIGHVREYTLGDILARVKRMHGNNVLFPMGYDSFGLPAENFAIKNNISPGQATKNNIANFQKQFERLGYSFDWDRSFTTTDPNFYKWTQWLFLRFFKAGLAIHGEAPINWCPFCKTGIANEEVINGRHERCDTTTEKKVLKQWKLKITDYADRLIDGLKDLDYPSKIADQQINWIGKSHGALIKFKVENTNKEIEVYSTAIDTIFGATFVVVAPEHPMTGELTSPEHKEAVGNVVRLAASRTELERDEEGKDKTGAFSGSYAINPINNQRIPIWVADYVLAGYGTGAIMAVPGHDQRDNEFALKYNLQVIYLTEENEFIDHLAIKENPKKFILTNSASFNGLNMAEARDKILAQLEKEGKAKASTKYKLHDWIFSRQRYWGEPIPIIHCNDHGPVAVRDEDLPVILPEIEDYLPSEDGSSPLSRAESWVNTSCPICSKPALRETDTMPNWAGSSWYYLRYYDPNNNNVFADPEKLKYWGMVDMYLGGMEHTTLHLLYSRFWHQFLYDQKLVPTKEPYLARRGQGIVLAGDGQKMSKSRGNVIDPLEIVNSGYGADALRVALAFIAPFDQTTPWNPEIVAGTYRFLSRTWNLVQEFLNKKHSDGKAGDDLKRAVNKTIKKVTDDIEKMSFNTAVAAQMELVNEMYLIKAKDGFSDPFFNEALINLVKLIAPFAPHLTEELWGQLSQKGSVHLSDWPASDDKYLVVENVTIAIQVNDKLRSTVSVKVGATKEEVEELALKDQKVFKHLSANKPTKVIYVQDKLINLLG